MSVSFKLFSLHGSIALRIGSLATLLWSATMVVLRRLWHGPQRPSWTLAFEIGTHFFQAQDKRVLRAAASNSITRCRAIADSLVFRRPALDQIRIEPEHRSPGAWFIAPRSGPTVLYLHGGGYSFYAKMTDNIAAALALAVGGRTFVAQYPLAPEHPFPSQLQAARRAYQWLLDTGIPPSRIVVAGDSAGGHLVLMLLLTLHETALPPPAAAIAISPWTDPANTGESMTTNKAVDWMSQALGNQLARWAGPDFIGRGNLADWRSDGDFASLPPLLVHAGEAEICRSMIEQFCARAAGSGAPITCVIWPDMNHNFHGFGDLAPQSREALDAIGLFVAGHVR